MSADQLTTVLRAENGGLPTDVSPEAIDRILTEPQQEQLAEAIAADAVDAAPLVGDIFALVRARRAAERGLEYPERPAFVENVLGDLPEPLSTAGDVLIAQNVLQYLEQRYNLDLPTRSDDLLNAQAANVDDAVATLLPDTGTDR